MKKENDIDIDEATRPAKRDKRGYSAQKRRAADGASGAGDPTRIQRLVRISSASVALAVLAIVIAIGLCVTNAAMQSTVKGDMTSVVVASRQLSGGETLEMGQSVVTKEVPAAYVPAGAIKATEFSAVAGHATSCPVASGSVITSSQVSAISSSTTLAGVLAAGQVAITVSCDAEAGVGGMLKVLDRVDVIGNDSGRVIATDIRVAALGSSVTDAKADYATVTLAVTGEQASSISSTEAAEGVRLVLVASSDYAEVAR